MPPRAASRKPVARSHRSTTKPSSGQPVVLTADEITGLQNCFQTWQQSVVDAHNAALSAAFLQEAYTARISAIRVRYGLTPQYEVDFETRVATPIEED